MDGLYFDTFGECPIDSSIPTDIQSGYSSCSEAEEIPCPRCLKTRGKLCRKCKLRFHARGDAKGNAKSSLELVSNQKPNMSDDHTAGQYLESLGLSKIKMPHRLSSDSSPTKYDEPTQADKKTSQYMMWGESSGESYRRRTNRERSFNKYPEWDQVGYVESRYSVYQEWNRKGTQEWSYSKYEEWHQRDYGQCWRNQHEYRSKRYRERSHFIQGRALQPCQIRSMKPSVDRDEPRYMAEIWQYTSGNRASSTRLVPLYGMQSCGILTLPYGSRVCATQRKLYLKVPGGYPWFILSRWAVRTCARIIAIAYSFFWYGKFPDPVLEELD